MTAASLLYSESLQLCAGRFEVRIVAYQVSAGKKFPEGINCGVPFWICISKFRGSFWITTNPMVTTSILNCRTTKAIGFP
jgi:hypothetical protein